MPNIAISELTAAGALSGTEEVPIVQSGSTVKTTTQDIANLGGGSSYLVYTGLIGQSGTSNPVETLLQNTFETVTWTRDGVGGYRGTWSTTISFDKIFILNGSAYEGDSSTIIPLSDGSSTVGYMQIALNNATSIGITIFDPSYVLAEWSTILGDTRLPIEFRVYP